MDLIARTGRHRQRYDEQFRLVAGCIPYRLKQSVENNGGDLSNRLEVLMISSPNRHDLVFPKGGWETDESVCEAACREALEEAGVKGIINETILGIWEFRSKSRENSCNLEGVCRGYMFAMEVTEELEWWPEQSCHQRRWVDVRESLQLCRYEWMREALGACIRFLSSRNAALSTTKCVDNAIDAYSSSMVYASSMVKLELSYVP
ncbi:diphosphoinositol-polyphosphate diphosphatase protein [Dioscorea alata]|nr:diphosphoinositol-polyphosphate diphosphatase protein [Dioscorea alata]